MNVGFGSPIHDRLVELIRSEVADWADEQRRGGHHPDLEDRKVYAEDVVARFLDEQSRRRIEHGEPLLDAADESELSRSAMAIAFGTPWEEHLRSSYSDVVFNGPFDCFATLRADGSKVRLEPVARSVEEFIEQIRWVGSHVGRTARRFDSSNPVLNMRLPNGGRLHAIYEVATAPSVTIRLHATQLNRLEDLAAVRMIDRALHAFLRAAVRAKQNIVVCGGMGAGKTTLLRAMLNEVPVDERLVTVEDELELGLDQLPDLHPDVVALEARPANVEGRGEFTMEQLLKECLRMNASRIVVGETRGAEVLSMLLAMTAGKAGSMATIHANSTREAFERLAMYTMMAAQKYDQAFTYRLVGQAVNFVVHVEQIEGVRRITSVREVVGSTGDNVLSNEVWGPDITGKAVPTGEPLRAEPTLRLLEMHGFDRSLMDKPGGWWTD